MAKQYYDLKTIKEKVAYVLDRYPSTRNSDLKLIANYMQIFHNIKTLRDWAIHADTVRVTPETIRRTRQALNMKGMYMPTSHKVLKQRGLLQDTFRNFAKGANKP